jgi:hypothetical protein
MTSDVTIVCYGSPMLNKAPAFREERSGGAMSRHFPLPLWETAEKGLFVFRRSQHERKIFNIFPPPPFALSLSKPVLSLSKGVNGEFLSSLYGAIGFSEEGTRSLRGAGRRSNLLIVCAMKRPKQVPLWLRRLDLVKAEMKTVRFPHTAEEGFRQCAEISATVLRWLRQSIKAEHPGASKEKVDLELCQLMAPWSAADARWVKRWKKERNRYFRGKTDHDCGREGEGN